jgi:putative hydrolase of the HAD superfamily
MIQANAGKSPSSAIPRAVIFDIGGVIVRVNVARAMAVLGSDANISAQQLWQAVESDPLWRDWQEGKIDPRDWHRHLAQKLNSPLDFDAFREAWCRVLEPEPIIAGEIFRELAARTRLALLSNTDPIHVACMEHNFSFVRYFPVRIYSCVVGARKPSPEIYRRALEELQIAPGEALYIDDVAEFAEAARQLGMLGYQFTGVPALEAELRRFGLLAA